MKVFKLLLAIVAMSWGTVATFKSTPATAAERMTFSLPVLGEFYLSVEDLEIYAKSGEITPSLAYYANQIDDKSLKRFREILQTSLIDDPTTVYRLTNTSMGENALRRLGKLVYTHPQRNGFYAIRAALIQGAAEPEGLTPISFLRHFPTKEIQLNTSLVFSIVKEVGDLFEYKNTTVNAIALAAQQEIATDSLSAKVDVGNLPNLSQPGKYQVSRRIMAFPIDSPRQTASGFVETYDLNVEIYLPVGLQKPAPLAVIAHGFGAKGSDFDYLAKHLASYGYIVALPEHGGSSDRYKKAFLRGEVGADIISPREFYSRPRDITHLLNSLEQHADFQGQINWDQVGVLGHSLGGTTALLVSGAALNWDRIQNVCEQDQFVYNVSIFLQCRAQNLPPGNYNFRDPRVKAVVALNSVGSLILGPESMSQIEIPTLIAGGTKDMVAPFVDEQVHPFLWLNSKHKYLATIVGANHVPQKQENTVVQISNSASGSINLDKNYYKILSLAFLEAHVSDRSEYQSYLTAAYGEKISNPELPIHLIQALAPNQLETSYGKEPPTAPIPESLVANLPQNRNVLAEIAQTGTLKVAMRTEAAPFSYLENDRWGGYCADFADSLGEQLTKELNQATPIKVEKLPSLSSNRFKLIEQEIAHVECGPNSIVANQKGVTFSDPFFSSGTRLLTKNSNFDRLDFDNQLDRVKLGVLPQTKTKQFLEQNYPNAEIVDFDGKSAISKGIRAIDRGNIDAFVSDGALLKGELDR